MSTVPAHDVMVESIASQRAKSGLLMFTASMELVHMNQEAMVLGSHINQARMRRAASGVLPSEVFALCEEIVKLLGRQRDAKEWEHFELRRMAGLPDHPVLLRGFGLPDRPGSPARILVIMERISVRGDIRVEPSMERYQLTEREEDVLKQLSKGLTNKEIACRLDITENTVKEHIKRLMQKMQTTTRTGLLSRILHAVSDQDRCEPEED